MDNIIKFPTWIIEKERELAALEHQLVMDKSYVEMEKYRIKAARRNQLSPVIVSFAMGMIVMGCILIPFIIT